MLDTLEFVLRILFSALSITWAGKIMILRTDRADSYKSFAYHNFFAFSDASII